MGDQRVVVVTGVGGNWGNRAAARLMQQEDVHVIGIDSEPPQINLDGLDFIQADLNNPLLVELFQEEAVETVLHLQFDEALTPSESPFDKNVMGTAKLLDACSQAGVAHVVLKSSIMVYGARPDNPMYLREDQPLNGPQNYGYLRDWLEVEKYADSFREQNPDATLTVLRFGHIVGVTVDSPMMRFLQEEEAITLLGFDPTMQLIHGNDVVAALVHAVDGKFPGNFNVAPERGMPLWKTLGLAGKIPLPVPHPLAYWSVSMGAPRLAPMPLDYLRYPCMGDVSKMRDALGFTPQYTAEETARELAPHQRVRKLFNKRNAAARDEDRLRDTIERRKQARKRTA